MGWGDRHKDGGWKDWKKRMEGKLWLWCKIYKLINLKNIKQYQPQQKRYPTSGTWNIEVENSTINQSIWTEF